MSIVDVLPHLMSLLAPRDDLSREQTTPLCPSIALQYVLCATRSGSGSVREEAQVCRVEATAIGGRNGLLAPCVCFRVSTVDDRDTVLLLVVLRMSLLCGLSRGRISSVAVGLWFGYRGQTVADPHALVAPWQNRCHPSCLSSSVSIRYRAAGRGCSCRDGEGW